LLCLCAVLAAAQCGRPVVEQPVTVKWSAAGLPPAYVERTWSADVPPALRSAFDDFMTRTHFFDLPDDLGGNDPNGRDMATYSITVIRGTQSHTVRYSDSTQSDALAEFRAWLMQNLAHQ
jgi:hypothetical protein